MDRSTERFLILRDSFFNHPKINALREAMGWDEDKAIGFMARFWHRVQQDAPVGVFDGFVTPEVVMCSLRVAPKIRPRLLEAMVSARLLDRDESGVYSVHNWLQHGGKREEAIESAVEKRRARAVAAARARWGSKEHQNDAPTETNHAKNAQAMLNDASTTVAD